MKTALAALALTVGIVSGADAQTRHYNSNTTYTYTRADRPAVSSYAGADFNQSNGTAASRMNTLMLQAPAMPSYGSSIAHARQEAAEDAKARAERIAKWERYCEPKIVTDKNGVGRYVYAKPGCDVGKSED